MGSASGKLEELAAQINELAAILASEESSQLTANRARRVRKTITEAYEKLRKVVENLDPIKHPGLVFDPSNPNVVGRIVGITMIAQPRKPLAHIERFYGSGVYALYYSGDYPAYAGLFASQSMPGMALLDDGQGGDAAANDFIASKMRPPWTLT